MERRRKDETGLQFEYKKEGREAEGQKNWEEGDERSTTSEGTSKDKRKKRRMQKEGQEEEVDKINVQLAKRRERRKIIRKRQEEERILEKEIRNIEIEAEKRKRKIREEKEKTLEDKIYEIEKIVDEVTEAISREEKSKIVFNRADQQMVKNGIIQLQKRIIRILVEQMDGEKRNRKLEEACKNYEEEIRSIGEDWSSRVDKLEKENEDLRRRVGELVKRGRVVATQHSESSDSDSSAEITGQYGVNRDTMRGRRGRGRGRGQAGVSRTYAEIARRVKEGVRVVRKGSGDERGEKDRGGREG